MSLPKDFRAWLAKESAAWNQEGLLGAEQREQILARYPEATTDSSALAFALKTLAVLLFGAAIFLVISHNWADLPRTGQLATVLLALVLIQGTGLTFFLKGQERSAIIGHLLGCVMYGGGIALIGQIYHLDAHSPDAVLVWCLFTIPFALLLDATVIHLLVIALAGTWLIMETEGYNGRGHYLDQASWLVFCLLLLPTAVAAYRQPRPLLTGALAWSFFCLVIAFAGRPPSHLVVLPLVLAALHPTGDARVRGFRFIGAAAVAFLTLALGSLHSPNDYSNEWSTLLRQDYLCSSVTAGLAIWAIIRARQRQDSHAAWLGLVAILALVISLLGSFNVPGFRNRDTVWLLIVAIANVTTLLLAVTLIRQGLAERRLRPYVYGALVFLAWLTWRYVDIEKDLGYLGMAGIFLFLGLILYGLALVWRQQREAEVSDVMSEFRPAWLECGVEKALPWRRALLFSALGLQLLVLGWMVFNHSRPLMSGERFLLTCEPVDPRSLTKGDYVILRYSFQSLTEQQKAKLLKEWQATHPASGEEPSSFGYDYEIPKDTAIYLPLTKNAASIAVFGEPSLQPPATGPFLLTRKGQSNWNGNSVDVRAGIESYYVPEGTGLAWEKLRNKGKLLAEVGILPNGQAGLISLQPAETASIKAVRFRTLERYFVTLKDSLPVTKVINTEAEFTATFHPAPLNGQNAVTPNFTKEIVILHTRPETNFAETITFNDVQLIQGALSVKVRFQQGQQQSYTIRPQASIVVPAEGVNSVEVRDDQSGELLYLYVIKLR